MLVPVATVPSAQNGTINLQFATQQNMMLATQLLNSIYAAAQQSKLNAQDALTAPTVPASAGEVNEFTLLNTGPNQATVPAGYGAVVNDFAGPATITGPVRELSETVLSTQGGLTFFTNGGAGTVIAAGGNNVIAPGPNLPLSGNGWMLLLDGGNNTVYATAGPYFISDGSREVAGRNSLFLGSGNETVQSWGTDMIVAAPGGTAVIATFHAGTVVYGNNGQTVIFNQAGDDTVVAGGGEDTVFAEAGGGLYFGNSGPLTFVSGTNANSTVVAGEGSAILYGAPGANSQFFVGHGQFMLDGGSGSQTVVGSAAVSGTVSGAVIFSEYGGSITLFGDTNNNLLVAGPGNVTLNAGASSGNDVLFAGAGNDCIVAGSGNNVIVGGPGSETLIGGSGVNLFEVNAAFSAGGNELIGNWNGHDQLYLFGYGPAGANGLPDGASMAMVNGSDVLTLPDGTRITFLGVPQVNAGQIHSS